MLLLPGCTSISVGRYELGGDIKLSMVGDDVESSWLNELRILFLYFVFLLVILVLQLSKSNKTSMHNASA